MLSRSILTGRRWRSLPALGTLLAVSSAVAVQVAASAAAPHPAGTHDSAPAGTWHLLDHINAGPTIDEGTLKIRTSGHTLDGGVSSPSGAHASLHGSYCGNSLKFVTRDGDYTVHYSGDIAPNGKSMSGGWVDIAQEGGSWNATLGAGSSVVMSRSASKCCLLSPGLKAATARATRDGKAVDVKLVARGLGPKEKCGAAAFSATPAAARRIDPDRWSVLQSKHAATATARLTGRESCTTLIQRAEVRQSRIASRPVNAKVDNGIPEITVAKAVRGQSGQITLTLKVDHVRAESACGKPTLTAIVAGARRIDVPFQKLKLSGDRAVGTAHLSAKHGCEDTLKLDVKQDGDLNTSTNTLITGDPEPPTCPSG